MKKHDIWISDLTHTAHGISANTFPLGASYVFAYAKQELGKDFNLKLFKFPSDLNIALCERSPKMLCFSNYSWNFELSCKFAFLAKQRDPNVVTVFGGPNFPTDLSEKSQFIKKHPEIDFIIELEGELAFVDLVKNLIEYDFNVSNLKKNTKKIINTCYLNEDHLISGPVDRIKDINIIPSPYLTGALDDFFKLPLVPMLETTRGCPFACTFCADGLASKNKIHRYDPERTKEEIYYLAKKVKNMSELIITDLNFGMYKQDLVTANVIADIQKSYNYPTLIGANVGKNQPERTMEVAKVLKGWALGASIQSTDHEVLKAVKRSNISSSAIKKFIDFGNNQESDRTNTEIILALPGDTKEKHLETIRFGMDNNVKHFKMYQAILLPGTEMASIEDRTKYGLITKFRIRPGCIGGYEILDNKYSIAEIEEIVVGNNTMSIDDYVDCRLMNLVIEAFFNNFIFEELFSMLRSIKISPLDCLIYLKDHPKLHSKKIKEIFDNFIVETNDLFYTWEEANASTHSPDIIEKYNKGEIGHNELLHYSGFLINEFDEICNLIFKTAEEILTEKDLLTQNMKNYLLELQRFTFMTKKDLLIDTTSTKTAEFKYDFEAIQKDKYQIDPNLITVSKNPFRFDFFHNKEQRGIISNQLKLYSGHAVGIGRLFQQTNLRRIFRSFNASIQ